MLEGNCILKGKIKWLGMTIIAGLFPILIRWIFFAFLNVGISFQPMLLSDVMAWGLVANISIFHERNRLFKNNSISTYFPIVSICFCIIIYMLNLINEVSINNEAGIWFNEGNLFTAGVVLCFFITPLLGIVCCFSSMVRVKKQDIVPKKALENI